MRLNDYQELALRTDNGNRDDKQIAVYALGISGEAGEVAELIKKWLGHGHDVDKAKLVKELGDVLWYVSALAACFGINLELIGKQNLAKLKQRYPDGFSHEASLNRGVEE